MMKPSRIPLFGRDGRSKCMALLCLIFGTPCISHAAQKVLILVPEAIAKQLRPGLQRYGYDHEARYGVKLHTVAGAWSSPEEVRRTVGEWHRREKIDGVILAGGIPMHRFHMHGRPNPNPLYYEDYELAFKDRDGDGVDDHYAGRPDLKLWVANWRATPDPDKHATQELLRFLKKCSDFQQRGEATATGALAVTASDWPEGAEKFANGPGARLVGRRKVETYGPQDLKLEPFCNLLRQRSYRILYIQVHSSETQQNFDDTPLGAETVRDFKGGAVLVLNHGCSTCCWTQAFARGQEHNVAQSWVFGRGSSLSLIGNVRSGMIFGHQVLYESLTRGRLLGNAYLAAKQAAENEMADLYPDGDVISGVTLVGNPLLDRKDLASP